MSDSREQPCKLVPALLRHAPSGVLRRRLDQALDNAARYGCHLLRAVAIHADVDKLTYVRGSGGILVVLAEALPKT